MKPRDQDRLMWVAIFILCLAGLAYGFLWLVTILASRATVKDFDGAAWTQAVGSVAAIGALVWQRRHEVATERARESEKAVESQNGARRLVQAAALICTEFTADQWPPSNRLTDTDCGVYQARLQAISGALRRIDAHALPKWQHTECVMVAVAALDALHSEFGRQVLESTKVGLLSVRAALSEESWRVSFKGMAGEFRNQLVSRVFVMSEGLDHTVDPP